MPHLLRIFDSRRPNHRQYRLPCNHQQRHNPRLKLSLRANLRVSDQQDESHRRLERFRL